MPPSADPLRRPIPRPFLERVSRALLVRLLTPYATPLETDHAFPLAPLAASAQTDRTRVDLLVRLLGEPPPALVPLRDELIAIAHVGTAIGHEVLLALDTARALDRELGAEDCAAVAALDHRALFEKARPQTAGGAQPKSFATFRPVSPRPLPADPACKAAFEKRMSDALYERNRSTFFKANIWRSGADHHMDLVFGRLAAARDLLGKTADDGARVQHDITAQVTDRSTERCHAIFHDDSGELDVSGHDWMKEIVRRSFGGAYFGSEAHFMGDETITLAPLADLEAALSTAGIPGIKSVELQEAWIDLGGDVPSWVCVGARGNCLNSPAADFLLRALSKGVPSEATFLLGITLRARALRVKLVPPRRMEFERRDPRVVRIVRDWVVAQRFMTVAEALGASDDAIESLRMSERGDP